MLVLSGFPCTRNAFYTFRFISIPRVVVHVFGSTAAFHTLLIARLMCIRWSGANHWIHERFRFNRNSRNQTLKNLKKMYILVRLKVLKMQYSRRKLKISSMWILTVFLLSRRDCLQDALISTFQDRFGLVRKPLNCLWTFKQPRVFHFVHWNKNKTYYSLW